MSKPSPQAFNLAGRVAVVTGATGGLGNSVARGLADHGASVVIVGRSITQCRQIQREIEQSGGRAIAVAADITSPEDRRHIVATSVAAFGSLDILINNAGVARRSPASEITEELYDQVHDVNTKSAFFLCQDAYPHLRRHGRGSIVNIVSIGLWNSGVGSLLYRSSKAAMQATTMVLAKEWASAGVRVNSIAPGAMEVGMGAAISFEHTQQHLDRTPMRRLGRGDEVVSAVVYLASDSSSFTTGSTLRVDGGAISI
ncbi:SDR family NAD(P)-dependent oxidoreductase [Williamsia muralis]|uniref:SDR family NAD(P)-dependent oxidoreductase n=1 Tax=Williamsia marianensis TaxID=85044 RepID=UPI001670DC76|nr:glucose 1-dehydrogenase [Williamsia marianensis]